MADTNEVLPSRELTWGEELFRCIHVRDVHHILLYPITWDEEKKTKRTCGTVTWVVNRRCICTMMGNLAWNDFCVIAAPKTSSLRDNLECLVGNHLLYEKGIGLPVNKGRQIRTPGFTALIGNIVLQSSHTFLLQIYPHFSTVQSTTMSEMIGLYSGHRCQHSDTKRRGSSENVRRNIIAEQHENRMSQPKLPKVASMMSPLPLLPLAG
ncbi:hypothetical protein BC827DRAFT_1193662 [Russula dissimulans]|nr:hypothetical protein BC827DRAFT_1193662 [Russula dissimulans]